MRGGAGLLVGALLLATAAARAQEVPPPARPGAAPRLSLALPPEPGTEPVVVRAANLLQDGLFEGALHDGFPVRFQFHLELWRDAALYDRLEREVSWVALAQLDPLSGVYSLTRTGGSVESFTSVDSLARALATPFTVDLTPAPRRGRTRWYYVATLDVESLSLSELDEVERWLRGDLGRAITREGDVGSALGRGARRLLIRFSGLPRRRLEARSQLFTF